MYDRVMATSLLTEGGRQGLGWSAQWGLIAEPASSIFLRPKRQYSAWATSIGSGSSQLSLKGSACLYDPNCIGDGHAMAWTAGATFTMMEKSRPEPGGFNWPEYGVGNASNTWFACTIVDANGKEIPWVDREGRVLTAVSERYRPTAGQKFLLPRQALFGPKGPPINTWDPISSLIYRTG